MKIDKRLILFFALSLIILGCQPSQIHLRTYNEDNGAIFIYLQPCPEEAERLKFSIESLYAVRTDGKEIPLNLSISDIKGLEMKRQRKIASNYIPEGSYNGLSIKIKKATLMVEDGEANLIVPEEPVRIDFPFTINKRETILLSLSFRYNESIKNGITFYPYFIPYIPDRPIVNLTGYVTNTGSDSIAVFDKRSGQVTSYILTGLEPKGMAINQTERRLYVSLSGEDAIGVIDILSGEVVNRFKLNSGDRPEEIALALDGRYLLSVNSGSNTVSIIDPRSLIEVGRISVGNEPISLLIDCSGRKAYIFNKGSNTISIIDIPNRAVFTTISTPDHSPFRGEFNKKCDRLYISYERSPYLSVINTSTLSEVKRIFVGIGISSLKVDKRTDMLYVGKKFDRRVEIYDPFSLIPVDFLDVGSGVGHITIDDEEKRLIFLLPASSILKIVDIVSKKTMSEMDVGDNPYWVAVMGERR